ncbi:MAG: AAA family ATPase [Actinobacteria bacterium]|nr:AAA family ATPase [Actinomycetota bacterium]
MMTPIVVMGATGSGKTTIGMLLARRLGVPFVDGDDYHDPSSIARMQRGEPLDDEVRRPWLDRLNQVVRAHEHTGLVLACSALTDAYRRRLMRGVDGVRFVFLRADGALLRERLAARHGHFAGSALVPSQLATLEPPHDGITVDAASTPDHIVEEIVEALRRPSPGYDSPSH